MKLDKDKNVTANSAMRICLLQLYLNSVCILELRTPYIVKPHVYLYYIITYNKYCIFIVVFSTLMPGAPIVQNNDQYLLLHRNLYISVAQENTCAISLAWGLLVSSSITRDSSLGPLYLTIRQHRLGVADISLRYNAATSCIARDCQLGPLCLKFPRA